MGVDSEWEEWEEDRMVWAKCHMVSHLLKVWCTAGNVSLKSDLKSGDSWSGMCGTIAIVYEK